MDAQNSIPNWVITPQGHTLNLAFLSKVLVMTTATSAWSVIYFHGIGAGKGATIAEKYGSQEEAVVAYNKVLSIMRQNVQIFDLSFSTTISISAITPNTGTVAGSDNVVLTGEGFSEGFSISINGYPATNLVFTDATTVSFDTPPNGAGEYSIVYSDKLSNTFVYPMAFTYS